MKMEKFKKKSHLKDQQIYNLFSQIITPSYTLKSAKHVVSFLIEKNLALRPVKM